LQFFDSMLIIFSLCARCICSGA